MTIANRATSGKSMQFPHPELGSYLIGKEEEELVLQVLRARQLNRNQSRPDSGVPCMADALEAEFCALVGMPYALAVTSGTAALEVALGALGIGPGDEVILPAWSWISCFTAVVRSGARPVLAEINDTLNLDPQEIERLATPNTKAVLVVHYQGVPAEMDDVLRIAGEKGVAVLEDCAESPGVTYHGKPVGTMGAMGTFSFQNAKTITTGEGGMVTTRDPDLYERAVRMHDVGQFRAQFDRRKPAAVTAFSGSQFRMNEMTAAVARAQLRKLAGIRQHCRHLQAIVVEAATQAGIRFRRNPDPSGDTGFEIYVLADSPKQAVQIRDHLQKCGIPASQRTGTYFHQARDYCKSGLSHSPMASPFRDLQPWPAPGYRMGDFPITEELIHLHVAIPIGVNYTEAHAHVIAAELVRAS